MTLMKINVCMCHHIYGGTSNIYLIQLSILHSKFLPHENYGDWELRGPYRENLHYLWETAVRITKKPYVYCG